MNQIDIKLDQEIERELDAIDQLKVGSDEHTAAVNNATKLLDRKIEIWRMEAEAEDKDKAREAEERIKEAERKRAEILQCIGYGVTLFGMLLTAGINVWGARGSWEFEKTGTVANGPGREFMKRIFSKK